MKWYGGHIKLIWRGNGTRCGWQGLEICTFLCTVTPMFLERPKQSRSQKYLSKPEESMEEEWLEDNILWMFWKMCSSLKSGAEKMLCAEAAMNELDAHQRENKWSMWAKSPIISPLTMVLVWHYIWADFSCGLQINGDQLYTPSTEGKVPWASPAILLSVIICNSLFLRTHDLAVLNLRSN